MDRQGKSTSADDDGIAVADVLLVIAILGSVQAFSSYSLFELMLLCGVPKSLAWVLPVSTDAVVILATKVWLNTRYGSAVRNYAMSLAIGAFVISVACAGIQHTNLVGPHVAAPEWLKFAIGAVPTAAAGFVVHLVAMMRSEIAKIRQRVEAERAEQIRRAEEKARKEAERAVKPATPKSAVDRPAATAKPTPVAEAAEQTASNLRELPAPGTPTKKELGIRWVEAQIAAGTPEAAITPVAIDRATNSNGYFKKHMDDVLAEARRRHHETVHAVGQ